MAEQDDSDPLPYVKMDRTAAAIAALLAPKLKVTFQHALGSLHQFWSLNGKPRDLEELLAQGKESVILTGDQVRRRFELASGCIADPLDLVELELVEQQRLESREPADLFRVRGMSRFFEPIKKRRKSNGSASEGGKKSAAARKEKYGSSVPQNASNAGQEKKPRKKKGPEQPELAGIPPAPPPPPRARSDQEERFMDFQSDREHQFSELRVPFVEDVHVIKRNGHEERKSYSPAYINTALSPILELVKPFGPPVPTDGGKPTGWERITAMWFADSWAAKIEPPFAFSAFASSKIYTGFIERMRKEDGG